MTVTTESFAGRFADADAALAWWLAWPLTAAKFAELEAVVREHFYSAAREALREADLSWSFAVNYYVAMAPQPPSTVR